MTGPVEKSALGQIGGTNGDELFEQPLSVIESGKETDDASFSTNEDEDHASLASSQVFLHPDRRGASSEHGMSLSEMTGTCEEQDIDIVPRESKTLTIIRVVNFLSLIAGTVAISLFLKVSTEEAEISGFESAFQDQASLLSNTWINRLDLQEGHVSSWEEFLKESQAPSQIIVVVKDQCREETRSFQLFGTDAENLGLGEKHDRNMSSLKHSYKLASYLMETEPTIMCEINLDLYPTPEMQSDYLSNRPTVNMTVPLIFGSVLLVVFMIYDCMVRKRHRRMTHDVVRSQKILSSLFPANVQERLFNLNMMESAAINFDLDVLHSPQPPRLSAGLNVPAITEKKNMEATVGDHSSRPSRFGSSKSPNTVPNRDCSNKIQVRVDDNSSHIQNISVFLSPPLVSQDSQRSIRSNLNKSEPIADLFPEATVMFADISGFTAWSSEREPTQVFRLLETIYRAFDKIAKKRKVFKVETIGDCYMAVTGLPDPMKDHAVVMTKFAKECMHNMNDLTRRLEMILGPGTAELRMRFGLNSGPVTAGVLRGEKSRFQLFGDTVNFASRMESTGLRNRIQVSQATADLLLESCLRHWIHPRNDLVHAKGKGEVQTYWVSMRSASGRPLPFRLSDRMLKLEAKSDSMPKLKSRRKVSLLRELSLRREKSIRQEPSFRAPGKISSIDSRERRNLLEESQHSNNRWYESKKIFVDHEMYDSSDLEFDDLTRQERLIDWNVEILATLLKRITASRGSKNHSTSEECSFKKFHGRKCLEEVTEIIPLFSTLPEEMETREIDKEKVTLPPGVESQLRDYVTMIACMYRDNFFHNFEHASHVLMSSQKLLKRVIIADQQLSRCDYTRAITSDPLTQFAIVISALIHDVDHTGVPNSQLVKEKAHIASLYNNKSIAEQNSLDLAWELLMEPAYKELQECIFSNQTELDRFRQLIVNVVMATDIFDPDIKAVRDSRFEKAFRQESLDAPLSEEDERNLKATIVIEYIMQASDVSHTMQHWQIYQRWNERLFEEMFSAWQVNRLGSDPSVGWYKGEIWFFDNYVIPLAKKLKECEVFGVASDEYLQFALENRKEWLKKGETLVESYIAKHSRDNVV